MSHNRIKFLHRTMNINTYHDAALNDKILLISAHIVPQWHFIKYSKHHDFCFILLICNFLICLLYLRYYCFF